MPLHVVLLLLLLLQQQQQQQQQQLEELAQELVLVLGVFPQVAVGLLLD
jgi:nitrate reductase NapE component